MKKFFYSLNFLVLLLLFVILSASGQKIGKVACKRLDEACSDDTSCCGEGATCEVAGNGNDTMVCVLREEEWCSKSRIGVACLNALSCCGGRCLADANNGKVCVEAEQQCRHLDEACEDDKSCCGEGTTCERDEDGNDTKVCVLSEEQRCSKSRLGIACYDSFSCCGGRCLADVNKRTVCVEPACWDNGEACDNDGGICCDGFCWIAAGNNRGVCISPVDDQRGSHGLLSCGPGIGEPCIPGDIKLFTCCGEGVTCDSQTQRCVSKTVIVPQN